MPEGILLNSTCNIIAQRFQEKVKMEVSVAACQSLLIWSRKI